MFSVHSQCLTVRFLIFSTHWNKLASNSQNEFRVVESGHNRTAMCRNLLGWTLVSDSDCCASVRQRA